MDKIYLLTTVHIGDPIWQWGVLQIERKRAVGWFLTLAEALNAVVNEGDIYEAGHYDHCVIEEMPSGLYPFRNWEKWFKWTDGDYLPVDRPGELGDACNFCLG